jgi:hypothetical protein
MKDGHTWLLLKGKSRNEEQRLPSFSKKSTGLMSVPPNDQASPARHFTTAEITERYGVEVQTVSGWCQRGLFPNAQLGPKTGSGAIYLIPASDLVGFVPPERGRPADAEPSAIAAAQRRCRERRRTAQADEPPSASAPADDRAG